MISLWSGPPGCNCWTSVAPVFQSWFAVEYSSCSSQWWILIYMYMFAVLIHWWVEVLHVDRTTSMYIWTTAEPRVRLLQHKAGLSSTQYYWPVQGGASVVIHFTYRWNFTYWWWVIIYSSVLFLSGKQDIYWIGFVSHFGLYRRQTSGQGTNW